MITAFKNYLQALGYASGSVVNLSAQVQSFVRYSGISNPAEATPAQIQAFYQWLHTRPNERRGGGISDSHIHHHLYALRVFFGWLEQSGQIQTNPISALVFKRPEKCSRDALTSEQISALFGAARTDRERALLHLLYSCGLRRTEAVRLDMADVHFKAQMLYVRRGKGCRRRAIPLPQPVADALEVYRLTERVEPYRIKRTGVIRAAHPTAFMLNQAGGRLLGNPMNALVQTLKSRAGIETVVTPHYLRHSIATHLLGAGVPIGQVKDFLGHSSLEATQLYAHVYSRQLKRL